MEALWRTFFTSWRALPVAILVGLLSAGCSGGGDEGPPPGNEGPNAGRGFLSINTPTVDAAYTTDRPSIALAGNSFTPSGAYCPAIVGVLPANFNVTWSNESFGTSGSATPALNCFLIVQTVWDALIALNFGANTLVVTSSDGAGNVGRDTITVTRVPDTIPPSVALVLPADKATNVATGTNVVVTFSETIDPASITTTTIQLAAGANPPVAASLSLSDKTATLHPTNPLAANMSYIVTVTMDVRDLAGNPLAVPFTSSFATGP